MVVLGIDPGFTSTGFGILKKEGGKAFLLDYGCLNLPSCKPLDARIALFYDFFVQKIETWQVTHIALETPFLGKNAQTFLKLGYLRGILYLLASKYTLSLHEFAPREVKLSVTGFGAAQKEQVARVILRLFPTMSMPSKLDVTDALAVTLCGVWKASLRA
ncbi:crossover junction endodeoxyribonuclease RuvC [Candidatus Dependentiae bacterium]|nr:crossover junction endodeoxyribonuclease RuvC [Candidatus Dependentiae bacterium]